MQNAIDSKVNGIAVTLAAPDAVGPMLQRAAQAGIPSVALNAGLDTYQKYGALMYFGSDEPGRRGRRRPALKGGRRRRSASCTPKESPPSRLAAPG